MEQVIDQKKLLVADRVTFAYKTRHQTVWAVRDVSYEFEAGKTYTIYLDVVSRSDADGTLTVSVDKQ